jgi:aminodeoxyfutalosine deaminase
MILTAQKLLTMEPARDPINNGAVAYRDGQILAAGPARGILKKFPGHRVYSLPDAVLMPGLVNLHCHIELPFLLDSIRAASFPDWILRLIATKKKLVIADYERAASTNISTLIRTGTTTVAEICTHGVSPDFLKKSGLRAVIFHEIISMGPKTPVLRLSSSASRPTSLVRTGLSPHSPYTVSTPALLEILRFSKKRAVPLAMHIAESKDEINLLRRKKSGLEKLYRHAHWDLAWAPQGSSAIEYVDRIGLLSSHFLAVHAVRINDSDIACMKRTKTPAAHCPRSNMETKVGKMPLRRLFDAGINVGLGTDSLASSPSLSMWDEMRFAYKIHKQNGISARDVLTMATISGAKALFLDNDIGTIEPGKKADMIAAPLPSKNTGNFYSDLLRETKSSLITMVNGRILYHDHYYNRNI